MSSEDGSGVNYGSRAFWEYSTKEWDVFRWRLEEYIVRMLQIHIDHSRDSNSHDTAACIIKINVQNQLCLRIYPRNQKSFCVNKLKILTIFILQVAKGPFDMSFFFNKQSEWEAIIIKDCNCKTSTIYLNTRVFQIKFWLTELVSSTVCSISWTIWSHFHINIINFSL